MTQMKTSKNYNKKLLSLICEAHKWEYTNINDNLKTCKEKKPKFYFTEWQWLVLVVSVGVCCFSSHGISADFAGYIISALSLFTGLLFSVAVLLFDKFCDTDFTSYQRNVNKDLHPLGIRLKNYYKKTIILILYTSIIAIVCIILLAFLLTSETLSASTSLIEIFKSICLTPPCTIICGVLTILYRICVYYFLLDFIIITTTLIVSFYDFMISKIESINLE